MPDLIDIFKKAGLTAVKTYINSGNVVFQAAKISPEQVCAKIETSIEKNFGFKVDVIARTASQWKNYAAASPFPTAESNRPKMLHLGLAKKPLNARAEQSLAEKALSGERIKIASDAIWVDFNKSVGASKLTPAVFEKAAGSSVTLRNWNTVQQIDKMLNEE